MTDQHWQSSSEHGWLTPPEYLSRLARLDRISLDPCGSPNAVLVADRTILWPDEDGLKADWLKLSKGGLVFCNPEYGDSLSPWMRCCEYWGGRGAEIVALVPAYPGAPWFDSIWRSAAAIHWWRGRIAFLDAQRVPVGSAPMYTASAYWGGRTEEFAHAFLDAGTTLPIGRGFR